MLKLAPIIIHTGMCGTTSPESAGYNSRQQLLINKGCTSFYFHAVGVGSAGFIGARDADRQMAQRFTRDTTALTQQIKEEIALRLPYYISAQDYALDAIQSCQWQREDLPWSSFKMRNYYNTLILIYSQLLVVNPYLVPLSTLSCLLLKRAL